VLIIWIVLEARRSQKSRTSWQTLAIYQHKMHDSTFLTLLPVVLLVVLSLTVAVYHYTGPEMTGEGFLTESTQPSDDICTCNRGKTVNAALIFEIRGLNL
jgi:hypothetical protein